MALDPNIIGGIRPIQIESPINMLTQALRVKGMQQESQLGQAKLDEYQRKATTTQSVNRLFKESTDETGKINRNMLLGKIAEAGLGSEIPGMQKNFMELDELEAKTRKEQRLAEKAQFEQARDELGFVNQIIASARDQASYTQGRQAMAARGMDVSRIPEQFDPAYVANAGQQTLTQAQRIEELWKQKGFDLDVKKFDETKRHHGAVERTAAGQLGVAQRREQREATAPRGQVIQTDDGPMLVDPRTGATQQITGLDGKPVTKVKPLAPAVVKTVTEARDIATTMDRLNTSFKPEFGGKGVFGVGADMSMTIKGNTGLDQDSVAWWKDYKKGSELVERHAMFGASLTPGEQASWRSADIAPGMDPEVIATNLATRAALSKKVAAATADDMVDAGHNEKRVRTIAGRNSAPIKVTNARDYESVPSGAQYITPDGHTRRKP